MAGLLPELKVLMSTDTVFHYTSATVAIEHILFERRLRLSPFRFSNDPREYKRWSFGAVGWGLPAGDQFAPKLAEADIMTNDILKNRYKVVCFCRNKDGDTGQDAIVTKGYFKSRMWAQYGDKHGGVCIAFSKSRLLSTLGATSGPENVLHQDIGYLPPGRDINGDVRTFDGNKLTAAEIPEFVRSHIDEHKSGMLFSKGNDYRDEDEYRIAVYDPESDYAYASVEGTIAGVILGDRFHGSLAPSISRECEALNAPCVRLCWHNGTALLTRRLDM